VLMGLEYTGTHVEDDPLLACEDAVVLQCKKNSAWRLQLSVQVQQGVKIISIAPYEYTHYDKETKRRTSTNHQFPIAVAFAVTIHRIQGTVLHYMVYYVQ